MKVYKVKVNGKVYEVELESVSENDSKITKEEVKEAKEAPVQEAKEAPVQEAPTSAEAVEVKAPMQGTINRVEVQVGDKVKKGQALCILEAMKLENEIVSPADGTVSVVKISKGQSVNNQELLFVIG
ncbi:MAG: biotin/lipoyl-binding protein [Bacilli bacterium]|nr:biotin/lipoyl-binding protein [Bacilli bacterium]